MNNTIQLHSSEENKIIITYKCPSREKHDMYEGISHERKIEITTQNDIIFLKIYHVIDGHGYPTKKGPKVKITTEYTPLPVELTL